MFWPNYFRTVNIPRLETMLTVLKERLLPTFDGIAQEATQKQKEMFDALSSMPCGEDGPLADSSEAGAIAHDAGLDHYVALHRARQALVNIFAVSIYHLWEQQVLSFHRRKLLDAGEQGLDDFLTLKDFQRRIAKMIDLDQSKCWAELMLFRDLANTVKHAEGRSAMALRAQRPQWFPTRLSAMTHFATFLWRSL